MLNQTVLKISRYIICLTIISSCGVKGKPQSPQKTPFIGMGISVTSGTNQTKLVEPESGSKK
jgi:hypothetical protein